jgi:lipoprotein signal peptidase
MQRTHRLLLWLLALTGFAADQASKYGVFASLQSAEGYRRVVIPEVFDLVADRGHTADGQEALHVNQGALFGWLQKWGVHANTGFAVVSLVAALVIIVWGSLRSTARDRNLCISLGLILAGTLGNLYDRVFFGGVRDFLHWHWGVNWPVFNLADCCLVIGAGLLLLQAFRPQPKGEEMPAEAASVANSSVPYAGVESK